MNVEQLIKEVIEQLSECAVEIENLDGVNNPVANRARALMLALGSGSSSHPEWQTQTVRSRVEEKAV